MTSRFDALVLKGRVEWPEMAVVELEAGARLQWALACGDVPAGAQALSQWIDARIALAAYVEVFDAPTGLAS